jgi:hypothetical protein
MPQNGRLDEVHICTQCVGAYSSHKMNVAQPSKTVTGASNFVVKRPNGRTKILKLVDKT